MKSLRRTQVFTANIAKMANVTSRMRGSLRVVHDRIPSTTYAISPAINRFTTAIQLAPEFPHFVRDFGCGLALGSRPQAPQLWCTGEDSNLRTSQGGADLQSAGFNHSPTCAMPTLQPCKSGHSPASCTKRNAAADEAKLRSIERARETLRTPTPHLEMLPYGVLDGKILTPPRRDNSAEPLFLNAGAGEGI